VRQQQDDDHRNSLRNFAFSPDENIPKSCPDGPSAFSHHAITAVSSLPGKYTASLFTDKHTTTSTPPIVVIEEKAKKSRKWYLGIQSRKDPELVMSEVFRALKTLRSQWQCVPNTPYRVTCRWRPSCVGIHDPNIPDDWVYVTLQLYKVQTCIYLLDFQRAAGISGSFTFMRLCSLIINALKAPAAK